MQPNEIFSSSGRPPANCMRQREIKSPPLLIHLLSSRCVVQHCPDLAPCRRRPPAALFTSVPDIRKKRHSLFHRGAPPLLPSPLRPSTVFLLFLLSLDPRAFFRIRSQEGRGRARKRKKGGGRREGRTGMRKELEEGTAFDETDAGG